MRPATTAVAAPPDHSRPTSTWLRDRGGGAAAGRCGRWGGIGAVGMFI
jgi:hypothetical protein